jgi:hypothetical protein
MMKHHLITPILLLLAFGQVSGFCQAAETDVADTTIFEGKLVDSLTDEMFEHMPDIETASRHGISARFLDVSSPDPKEVNVILSSPEGQGFYRPGDLYIISASKVVRGTIWRAVTYMADAVKAPLICDSIRHEASSPHLLKDSGIKKLSVFTGNWRAWNTDSADKGKIFAVFTCQFSPNGQYLISDRVVTNNGAVTNIHSTYSYSKEKDSYSMTVIGVPGAQPFTVPIAYEGDSLIYHTEYTDSGKKKYARTLDIFLSTTSYIFLVQSSENGWYWHTDAEGKATKVESPK